MIESPDRLTRLSPRKALRLLESIVEEGVTIITIDDGAVYTEENLETEFWRLLTFLIRAQQSHEYSKQLSRRMEKAWNNRVEEAINGTSTKRLTAKCPAWLATVNPEDPESGFRLIPEKAALVRRIFDMYVAGKGSRVIAKELNGEGIALLSEDKRSRGFWREANVRRLLDKPAVAGTLALPEYGPPHPETKRRKPIPGRYRAEIPSYYPAAVPSELWERVKALRQTNHKPHGKTLNFSVFGTLMRCEGCGSSVTTVSRSGTDRASKRLVCQRAKHGAGCDYKSRVYDDVYETFARHAVKLLQNEIPGTTPEVDPEIDRWDTLASVARETLRRLYTAVETGGPTKGLLERIKHYEDQAEEAEEKVREGMSRLADSSAAVLKARCAELLELIENEDHRDPEWRARTNAAMRLVFREIRIVFADENGKGGALLLDYHNGGTAGAGPIKPASNVMKRRRKRTTNPALRLKPSQRGAVVTQR